MQSLIRYSHASGMLASAPGLYVFAAQLHENRETSNTCSLTRPLAGKVAVVAGASRGMGAATVRAFADAGAAVVLGGRDSQALESLAEDIRSRGGQALALPTDVGDVASVANLVEQTLNTFGRLDAAFNNANDGPLPAPLAT